MLPAELIAHKRNGHALSDGMIRDLINGFVSGEVADYQMSAWAMAVCWRGMSPAEICSLTRAMHASGKTFRRVGDKPRIDKHSTGGLGDKVSLVLAPLLAAAGGEVPMISGRGLGHTGGTLDKLESIEGFRCHLDQAERERVLRDVGACIVGADADVAPADQKLYALRDVTATVDSLGLITASILSKKLAANLDALVMDVKVGNGAFMTDLDQARRLARCLADVGQQAGLPTAAVISDMDQPLGHAIGHGIEVNEAVRVLRGGGPPDVRKLCIELATMVLSRVGLVDGPQNSPVARLIDGGQAHEVFQRMVQAQGGRWRGELKLAPGRNVHASRDGYLAGVDCRRLARCVQQLGGGRRRKDEAIDHSVGIHLDHRLGERIAKGDVVATVHCHNDSQVDYATEVTAALAIEDSKPPARPLIRDRIPYSMN